MSKKILAVFGATGQQGSSVINYILNDPELSQEYEIRAITRDVNSEKAKQLKKKVNVSQGDVLDRASLKVALAGVQTVFAMTTPSTSPDAFEIEVNNGKAIADAAVEQGAEYIIFSTLPAVNELSGGKYPGVVPFDAKAKIEQYIRSLPTIKSAFYALGSFMENFQAQGFLAPREAPDGTWIMTRHVSAETLWPLIDAVGDTGKFVGAILAEPDKYEGKTFHAAQALYTFTEIVAIMSKATGKTIIYQQIPREEFLNSIPIFAEVFVQMFGFSEEFGYFGPGTKDMIAWSIANARGKLSTLDDFFKAHPLTLE
jgi:uncharacterized protein YbjT (DUF2867 family)